MEPADITMWLQNVENIKSWVIPIIGSFLFPFALFMAGRSKKCVSYKIIEQKIHSTETREDGTKYYIYNVAILYSNKGNEALEKSDFPIGISTFFLKNPRVHSATIRNTSSSGQMPIVNLKPNQSGAFLSPELFNPDDYCIVDYRVEGFTNAIYVKGKVKGQKGAIQNRVLKDISNIYSPISLLPLGYVILYRPFGPEVWHNIFFISPYIIYGIMRLNKIATEQCLRYPSWEAPD